VYDEKYNPSIMSAVNRKGRGDMELQEAIETRRSVRKYQDKPVSREQIEQVVALAAHAPSWKNSQISRYLVLEGEEKAEVCRRFVEPAHQNNAKIVDLVPALVVQTFVTGRSGYDQSGETASDRGEGWQYYDCGIAAQTFCLAAHDMGLGTVIMGIFDRKGLQDYLNLPQGQEVMALIALGYPQGTAGGPKRKGVEELLSFR